MKCLFLSLVILLLSACGERQSVTEKPSIKASPTDTVESLLASPDRLKTLRKQCRINRAKLGDELCNTVGEFNTKAFLGDGEVKYRPPKEKPAF